MGSPLHVRLSGALGTIDEVSTAVSRAARTRWADEFDLADTDDEGWHADDQPHWQGNGAWAYQGGYWDAAGTWCPGAPCNRGGDADEEASIDMDTGDVQVPAWMQSSGGGGGPPTAGAASGGGGRVWKRGRWHYQDVDGTQGRHADPSEVPSDHAMAAQLQARCSDATSAAPATPTLLPPAPHGAATDATHAAEVAGESLDIRRREIWDLAQAESAEVSYEQICGMDAADLEEWAAAHLNHI